LEKISINIGTFKKISGGCLEYFEIPASVSCNTGENIMINCPEQNNKNTLKGMEYFGIEVNITQKTDSGVYARITERGILTSYIIDRVKNITNDCRSFIKLRIDCEHEIEKHDLGGGNLLEGMGLFSVVGYLAKIYYVSRGGYLKSNGEVPDETKRVGEFISSVPEQFFPGIDDHGLPKKEAAIKIWGKFRHALTHLIAPKGMIIAYDKESFVQNGMHQFKDVEENYSNSKSSFISGDYFFADIALYRLNELAHWLASCVMNERDIYKDQHVSKTIKYLDEQLRY